MRRRHFLFGAGAMLLAAPLQAQRTPGPYRVGMVTGSDSEDTRRFLKAFVEAMERYGYQDGRNLELRVRNYAADREKIPAFAEELIAWQSDVVVANVSNTAMLLKKKTTTIPIVMVTAVDAVGEGLVASLARPGGNITGMTSFGTQGYAKLVELSADLMPKAKRFALLANPLHALSKSYTAAAVETARARGIEPITLQISSESSIAAFGKDLSQAHADALVILTDAVLYRLRDQVLEVANRARVPTIAYLPEFIASGAVATVGYDLTINYRNAARYVDQILRGAKPAELPIEQPTQFQLVLNLKSARAFGVRIPNSVLARADRVIE